MKEKIMARLPFIFAYYSIITIVTCTYNLLLGYTLMENRWFLELLAFLVVFTVLDHVISFINFRSYIACTLMEIVAAYSLFLIFSYFFGWISFTPQKLLSATLLFLLIAVVGIAYMNYRYKLRTKELNDLIKKQQH